MKKNEDVFTGLTLKGNVELGKSLIEAAQKKNREDFSKKATDEVQSILKQIQQQEIYVDSSQRNIRVLKLRLEKIEKGEFEFGQNGEIKLLDDTLAPHGLDK